MTDEELKQVTFSEEDTKEMGGFIREGIHEVTITKVEFKKNGNGKPFLNVEVKNEDDATGSSKIWFTGNATPYSINTIRTIFVHNAETKEDKDKLRDFFKGVENLYVLSQTVNKLVGKQCWYAVEKTDETYEDDDGNTKHRYDRSVWGYEPNFKNRKLSQDEVLSEAKKQDSLPTEDEVDQPIDLSEIPF